MTWIRIDPNEMESASRELQSCSDALGGGITGLQGQCAGCAMPAAVAAQVSTTVATVERQLHDIRVELLLEATILAVRGILAVKGSPVAGTLSMEVAAPTTGFVGGNPISGFTITNPDGSLADTSALYGMGSTVGGTLITSGVIPGGFGTATVGGTSFGGFTITNPDGTPADPAILYPTSTVLTAPTNPSTFGLNSSIFTGMSSGGLPGIDFESPFIKPEANDFPTWSNSMTRDSDGDGTLNGMDANPGSYDPEYTDRDPSTKPPNI